MHTDLDIAVIGAGAAGLTAGIFAAETDHHLRIAALDGARNIGAKILVSGGGRCNVTNELVTPADFHAPRRIVDKILKRFDEHATVRWFESMGVPLKQEAAGKLFPVSNKARAVLQALLRRCNELGIQIRTQHRVKDLTPSHSGFQIVHEAGQLTAHRVIMATGGQSLPKSGSDGHGWSMARRLGHTVTPTYPALVPLVLDNTFFHHRLSGISHEATLSTRVDRKIVDRRSGSLLWTHVGVSGPVVLDASRFWVIANGQGRNTVISVNFMSGKTLEEVDRWLSDAAGQPGRKTVVSLLSHRLPHRVAQALCAHIGKFIKASSIKEKHSDSVGELGATAMNKLRRPQRRALAQALTNLPLPVVHHRGWNYAEVTAGGIPLEEVNPHSMASRHVSGLYIIGEMLDCDGRIGGFNFQWAWSTGYIAGCRAASASEKSPMSRT